MAFFVHFKMFTSFTYFKIINRLINSTTTMFTTWCGNTKLTFCQQSELMQSYYFNNKHRLFSYAV